MAAVPYMLALANDSNPIIDNQELWMKKRLMLQAKYSLAAVYVSTRQLEYSRRTIMSCREESIYAMESLAMFFGLWRDFVQSDDLKKEKRSQMSAEGIRKYATVLEQYGEHEEAMDWLLTSANMGNADAMDDIATHLLHKDIDEACL